MRKLPFVLLLATAAAPAVAQSAGDDGNRGGRHHRNNSAEQTESRPQRQADSQQSPSSERQSDARPSEHNQASEQGSTERSRTHFQQQQQQQRQAQREQRQQDVSNQSDNDNTTRAWRGSGRGGEDAQTQSSWQPRERQIRTIPDTQPNVTTPRRGEVARTFEGRPRRDYRDGNYTRWSSNHWRSDRRYDWRSHRNRHRSIFHLGFYYDPFGWSYRRWSIGSYLWPNYYRSSFWLDDPWDYRLPPAYGPYRWVRYWDDALLVNIYTGQVVDVIHNFFW
jgi:Nickel/cobalt transporter regulator